MKKIYLATILLALGFLTTLISGVYRQNFVNSGKQNTRYGLPLGWHGETQDSDNAEQQWYSWQNFAFDVVTWTLLFGFILLVTKPRRLPT
jgi:hypothetical protein